MAPLPPGRRLPQRIGLPVGLLLALPLLALGLARSPRVPPRSPPPPASPPPTAGAAAAAAGTVARLEPSPLSWSWPLPLLRSSPLAAPRRPSPPLLTTGVVLRSPYRAPIARPGAAAGVKEDSGATLPASPPKTDSAAGKQAAAAAGAAAGSASVAGSPPNEAALLGGPLTLGDLRPGDLPGREEGAEAPGR